jgi:phage terminase large subunit-like protein
VQTLERVGIQREAITKDLIRTAQYLEPRYSWQWFHREIASGLMDPEAVKILVSLPPQHFKSSLVAVFYPIWYLGHYPDKRIMVVTYSSELAEFHSSRAMQYFQSEKFFKLFGLNIDKNVCGKGHWKVAGHDGFYHAVGIHGLTSGIPVDLLIIDDYYASMKEALSEAVSKSVKSTYSSALCYRLQDETSKQIISATRWADDDLQGDMIKKDEIEPNEKKHWEKYIYPAFRDYIGKDWFTGIPLMKSKAFYEMQLKNSSPVEFETEFMCNPVPFGDMMITPDEFEIIDSLPEGAVSARVRGWDIAYTGNSNSNDSAHALLISVGNEIIIAYAESWVEPWHTTKPLIVGVLLGDDPGILQSFETNGGQSALIEDLQIMPELMNCSIYGYASKDEKQLRALPWMLRAKGKTVKVLRGAWNAEFFKQISGFRMKGTPKFCGMIDAVSKAWEGLSQTVDLSAWINVSKEEGAA